MKLLTEALRQRLIANGEIHRQLVEQDPQADIDPIPLVKLFTPDAGCIWLITEICPEDPDIAFGLCDLGMGCPELGYVSLSELESVRGKLGLPVERDLHFSARKTIRAYAEEARRQGGISA